MKALTLTTFLALAFAGASYSDSQRCTPQKGTCNFVCVYASLPNMVEIQIRNCPASTPNEWANQQGLDTIPTDTTKVR